MLANHALAPQKEGSFFLVAELAVTLHSILVLDEPKICNLDSGNEKDRLML